MRLKNKPYMAIILLTVVLYLTSCRSSRTTTAVTRSEAREETTVRDTRVTDSIFIHDSVIVKEKPDTVWLERWRTCWRERIVHDTVREHTTDTVVKTVDVVKESPAASGTPLEGGKGKTPGWAWLAAAILAVLVAVQIIRVRYRLNKL